MPCYRPITLKPRKGKAAGDTVPCGTCLGCGLEYSRQWTVRLMHEKRSHSESSFLTLTYSDENIPVNMNNGMATLYPRDTQLFLKRLRKKLAPLNIRFYLVGEYGDSLGRPHYHVILFGYSFPDKKFLKYSNKNKPLYTSQLLNETWGLGDTYIGDVQTESIAYVARYTLKKQKGNSQYYVELGITPEFNRMSRHPSIGKEFFSKFKDDIYQFDYIVIDGKKTRPPRYYDKLLQKHDPYLYEQLKIIRKKEADKNPQEQTPKRLLTKEQVKKAQISELKRRFL